MNSRRKSYRKKIPLVILPVLIIAAVFGIAYVSRQGFHSQIVKVQTNDEDKLTTAVLNESRLYPEAPKANPLAGRKLYIDNGRKITLLAHQYAAAGNLQNSELIKKISSQPGTTWLTGPSAGDPDANRDIAEVQRTSADAAAQGTLPVYQLYAVPNRDACAAYSKGGFTNSQDYLSWIDRILAALQTDAVFTVETDSMAQMVDAKCLNAQQVTERQNLLKATLEKLAANPKVVASYLDAGHPEWVKDQNKLVSILRASGIDKARGIAVNVSFFISTPEITAWSQKVVAMLGGDKGIIIDTSRNGRGVPAGNVTGESRWCNPHGRGLGRKPTTNTKAANVDAYMWVKNVGESDGSCFGNPPAGTLNPDAALELARNSAE